MRVALGRHFGRERFASMRTISEGWAVLGASCIGLLIWWPVLALPERRTQADATVAGPRDVALARLEERPLFNPARRTRRPLVAIEPREQSVEPTLRTIDRTHVVKGVGRTDHDAIALVEHSETRQTTILRVGSVVEGFAVAQITAEGVVFRAPGGDFVTLHRSLP